MTTENRPERDIYEVEASHPEHPYLTAQSNNRSPVVGQITSKYSPIAKWLSGRSSISSTSLIAISLTLSSVSNLTFSGCTSLYVEMDWQRSR